MSKYQWNPIEGNLERVPNLSGLSDVSYSGSLPIPSGALPIANGSGTFVIQVPSTVLAPTVNTYADLPSAAAHTGQIYIVLTTTGTYPFLNEAGMYYSNGVTWSRLGNTPTFFSDANFRWYNNSDNSKQVSVDLSGISTSTTRTWTALNASGYSALAAAVPTTNRIPYANSSGVYTDSASLQFDGTYLGIGMTPNTSWGAIVQVQTAGSGGNQYAGLVLTDNITNNTNKGGMLFGAPYANANKIWTGFGTFTNSTEKGCWYGGGGWNHPDANAHYFYTAPTFTETNNTGLLRAKIDSAGSLLLTPGDVTGSSTTSGINYTQTWNTSGVVTAWKMNITNTARGSFSKLIDLQTDSTSRFAVVPPLASGGSETLIQLNGSTVFAQGSGRTQFYSSSTAFTFYDQTGGTIYTNVYNSDGRWEILPATFSTAATRYAYKLTQTWANASGDYYGLYVDITNTNSASTSRLFDFRVGGTSQCSLTTGGALNAISYKVNGTAGADGTFTTADGKTVTITKGLVTNIV